MINAEEKNSVIVTVDRIEGEYAVCLMPDYSTADLKIPNNLEIKENDKIEVRYSENNDLVFLGLKPKTIKKRKKIPTRFIRFN